MVQKFPFCTILAQQKGVAKTQGVQQDPRSDHGGGCFLWMYLCIIAVPHEPRLLARHIVDSEGMVLHRRSIESLQASSCL